MACALPGLAATPGSGTPAWLGGVTGSLLVGPVIVVALAGCLASTIGLSWLLRCEGSVADLASRSRSMLDTHRAPSVLMGIASTLVLAILTGALINHKAVALFGAVSLLVIGALASIGFAVASQAIGESVHAATDNLAPDMLTSVRTGSAALLIASVTPIAGWVVVSLVVLSGIGAVVLSLMVRRRPLVRASETPVAP